MSTTNSGRNLLSSATHNFLCFGSVVACVLFDTFQSLACSFAGDTFDLSGLLGDDIRGMFQLTINDVLVLDIDQGAEVEDACAEEGETPQWHNLNQVVGEESGEKCLEVG